MIEHIIAAPIKKSILVRAGPGAGKTYLIANRIAHLLQGGIRRNSHVACITYTNSGVDEVERELIPTLFTSKPTNLFLGTIHSFLLDNILKPYGHFLDCLPGELALTPPDGYASRFMTRGMRSLPAHKLESFEAVGYDEMGNLVCYRPIREGRGDNMWTPSPQQMSEFKSRMHEQGHLDLHDVLFFSLRVLQIFPFVAECLSSRFASILVDEFQDTTVIQAAILEIFLDSGQTSLFLVGDPDQSIFSFAGASPRTFKSYFVDERFRCETCGSIEHQISVNRRSSQKIVDFLNTRSTMQGGQVVSDQPWASHDQSVLALTAGEEGVDSTWLRGQALSRFFHVLEINAIDRDSPEAFAVLAHQNKLVALLNALDSGAGGLAVDSPLDTVRQANRRLHRFVHSLLLAIKHKRAGEWVDAYELVDQALTYQLYRMTPHFCSYDDEAIGLTRDLWRVAVWLILDQMPDDRTLTLLDWCGELKSLIDGAIRQVGGNSVRQSRLGSLDCRGGVRPAMESGTVGEAISAVFRPNLLEENFRTIHRAKGTQRDSVFVMADNSAELEEWVFCPDLSGSEVSRRGFVAFSRARKVLCICCDSIETDLQQRIEALGVTVEIIRAQPKLF